MLHLRHFVPPNHKQIVPSLSANVQAFMPELIKTVGRTWTPIPGSELETFLQMKQQVPCHAFRKNKQEVYVHVFGFEGADNFLAFNIVFGLYVEFKWGPPQFPGPGNWMHSIPLPGPTLTPSEILLIHQVAHSLFWTVNDDFNRNVLKNKGLKR